MGYKYKIAGGVNMQIMIKPLDGVYWEDKCLRLGDNREIVMNTFEKKFPLDGSYFCFRNELRISP